MLTLRSAFLYVFIFVRLFKIVCLFKIILYIFIQISIKSFLYTDEYCSTDKFWKSTFCDPTYQVCLQNRYIKVNGGFQTIDPSTANYSEKFEPKVKFHEIWCMEQREMINLSMEVDSEGFKVVLDS